jgi:predicted DNA-binding WGR domain protein
MSRQALQTTDAELEKIEPAANAYRFYRLGLWDDLFGRVTLMREWGRIGRPGQRRLDPFDDRQQAEAALSKLVQQKRRRGYLDVS